MNTMLLVSVLLAALADPPAKVTLPGLEDENAGLTREQVLKSPEWRQTMLSLSAWFDTQRLYNKEQVLDLKRKINERAMNLSPVELLRMQHDITEKLAILNGPEARAIRTWLREQLALASDEYAKKLFGALPDISKVTPDELQDYLNQFAQRIEASRRGSEEFLAAKSAQAQMVTTRLTQQRQEADRAISAAVSRGGGGSGVIGSRNVTGAEAPWGMGGFGGWGGGWGGWGGYRW